MTNAIRKGKTIFAFVLTTAALLILFFISINLGSIKLEFMQLFRGLFIAYDQNVAAVYDLRFPRILISMLAGASLAVAGVLFQAVLKNPLADAGILGVSSGSGFAAIISTAFFPNLFFMTPLFSFMGGLIAFALVYALSWKGSLSPLRIILTGIAIQSLFSGLSNAFNAMSGSQLSGVASIVEGNITMKTWDDVKILVMFSTIGLILALICANWCNLCGLEDKTVRGLGINIDHVRLIISLVAVFLTSGCTAIVGVVSFIGLLVPHIGRILVGSDHKILIPISALLGALMFLLADTIGRTIAYPYEINAAVILSIVGGIMFIILLRKNGGIYGK